LNPADRTFVLSKSTKEWEIVHEHHSYPTRMDGSGLAAIDLHPAPPHP
jgi:hypothetical protein